MGSVARLQVGSEETNKETSKETNKESGKTNKETADRIIEMLETRPEISYQQNETNWLDRAYWFPKKESRLYTKNQDYS